MIEKLKIAVLSGGPGSEKKISQASANSVFNALKSLKINCYLLEIESDSFKLEEDTDLAYIMIHGTYGEDGQIQKKLEKWGIPYTGASSEVSSIAFDKILSKYIFEKNKVSTPEFEIIKKLKDSDFTVCLKKCEDFGFPLVIKPSKEGSSVGIHIVKNKKELQESLKDTFLYGNEALIEKYIEGRELTIGILDGKAFPIVEIIPKDGFYDINNKYPWLTGSGSTQYECPANLSKKATENIKKLAIDAYNALNIEVYARVDVLYDEENDKSYVLEANTIPGMTESSLLPKSAQEAGVNFENLCKKIAEISYDLRK